MARTADQIQRDVDRLKAALASGVLSCNVDGQSTTFDNFDGMRKRVAFLESELAAAQGACNMAKPRLSSFNLGGRT